MSIRNHLDSPPPVAPFAGATQPRRRTPSRVLAAAIAAVVAATAVLAGCGDDGRSEPPRTTYAPGAVHRGTGYELTIGERWRDITTRFNGSALRIDRAFMGPTGQDGHAPNLVIVRETPLQAVDLEQATETFRAQGETVATGPGVSATQDRELDGEPAKTYVFSSASASAGGAEVVQRQVVAIRDDAVYTITFSAAPEEFGQLQAVFERVLQSWRWR